MSRVDPLDSLKNFEPKTATEQKTKQSNAEVEQMANQHGFVSRQPAPLLPQSNGQNAVTKLGAMSRSTSKVNRKPRTSCTALLTISISR